MANKPPARVNGQSVDYAAYLDDTGDRGKPLSTIGNLDRICQRLGVTIRYNVISKRTELLIPSVGFPIDNQGDAALEWLISECAKFRMPIGSIPGFVTHLGSQNLYNPVATWIESKPWDGEDRIPDLLETIVAKNESTDPSVKTMKRNFLVKWMISAVAAAFKTDGVSAHGVLVFQGEQYIGKTKWFKSLVPQELGVLKDGMFLRPDDRDSVMRCISHWLVELGELDATFRKADLALLKSFLTSDRDVWRLAYGRADSHFPRRTVFFASVNPESFLHDETGNRRYWTIAVEKLDYDHTIDMQQVWAQILVAYRKGESWYLTDDEFRALNTHNADFETPDPIVEIVSSRLDWSSLEGFWEWRTTTDVLTDCGVKSPTKGEVTRAGTEIRRLNKSRSRRSNGIRYVLVPPLLSR